ncbi:MAG: hypothetical protein ACOC7R_03315 [Planctomycetota bacterium]
MAVCYSERTCRALEEAYAATGVVRPLRVEHYDAGTELTYRVTGVVPAVEATVRLQIDKFVGGGFAGQVYRVTVLEIDGGPVAGLAVGRHYAMKILIPPSGGSVRFRNLIYWMGFQSPFSLQVNPDAARAGALWQKFIRRAASIEFGTERAVVDILATFVDERMGSCGEFSEWLEGRNWKFEVDDHLERRKQWTVGDPLQPERIGAPEYRAKKAFMARLVGLFHAVGAPELARQYEWWTCKSQPNVLKRLDGEGDPQAGLTAVDFRAGLALLAYLPMSPGDIKLIYGGLKRGSLVQFDRGDVDKLAAYVDHHGDAFDDMAAALVELRAREQAYRHSQIDVTHHHVHLLRPSLWRSISDAAVTGWRVRNFTDNATTDTLSRSRPKAVLFALLGFVIGLASTIKVVSLLTLIGALAVMAVPVLFGKDYPDLVPLAGVAVVTFAVALVAGGVAKLLRKLWGRADLRRHYLGLLGPGYLLRAARAHAIEGTIRWHRAGRIGAEQAERWDGSLWRFAINLPLSILPAGLHRMCLDRRYAWERLTYIVTRPLKLYFDPAVRERWMQDMLVEGEKAGMITADEANAIRDRLGEPYIQKYLKSLAVHVCTLPVTQVVSVIIAIASWNSAQTWGQNMTRAGAIIAAFQVIPISPGSLTRGLYALGMAIKDRSYTDYNIAVWMSFWKYIGYLAFPVQMANRYPTIARFMAGRWATGAVHAIPVFGEHGALAEHAVFDLFYNRPLTVRTRMEARARRREAIPPRRWHMPACAVLAWALVAQAPVWWALLTGQPTAATTSPWLMVAAGALAGFGAWAFARGASGGSRIVMGLLAGLFVGVLTLLVVGLFPADPTAAVWPAIKPLLFPAFFTALAALAAALIAEVNPRPVEDVRLHPAAEESVGPAGPVVDARPVETTVASSDSD